MTAGGAVYYRHFTVTSHADGLELDGLMAVPEEPRAILQIAHGMCEYKERYLPFLSYMAERGFVCAIHDHRGHGRSAGGQEELGYLGENGGKALVKDLHQVGRAVRNRFPGLPFFLMGHSMGSLAARVYLKYHGRELDGLVVCGSPGSQPGAFLGLELVSLLSALKGGRSRSPFLDGMLKVLDWPFRREAIPHAWICSDRAVVERYNEDPYCNFTFTLNGYAALLWLLTETYGKRGWREARPGLPILFISGAEDPCQRSKKGFFAGVQFLRDRGYDRLSSRLYPGMRHEILNEPGRREVYQDIAAFLGEHLSARS